MHTTGLRRVAGRAAAMLAAVMTLGGAYPAAAIPPAGAPTLLGVRLGAEVGFAGQGVGSSHVPYFVWAEGGVARMFSVKGELLGGNGAPTLKNLSGQYSLLPTPVVSVMAEPGITWVGNSTGPSFAVRATGSAGSLVTLTGYARVHYLDSRATSELGFGGEVPLGSGLRGSLSAIEFNGGFERSGVLFLAGVSYRLGL